ncbi:MAG TPA: hypothetical protein VG797_08930 [Phycisphaerales bacterium]|nr:hypothetical protein [Phycisphaerales bacterium]
MLRSVIEPGEHLVGWGLAAVDPKLWEVLLGVSLQILPGVGSVLVQGMVDRSRQLLVLTDRRLIALGTTRRAIKPGPKVEVVDMPLGVLRIERVRAGLYRLMLPGDDRYLVARLPMKAENGAGRLARAFEALAQG